MIKGKKRSNIIGKRVTYVNWKLGSIIKINITMRYSIQKNTINPIVIDDIVYLGLDNKDGLDYQVIHRANDPSKGNV